MKAGDKTRRVRNIIGRRVKEARQSYRPRLTQDHLSGKLAGIGVLLDRVAIAKIETGTRCVFDFEIKGLARVLKVDANWLLGVTSRSSGLRKSNS